MLIALAFANGFQQKVSQKVFSFWGHIHIIEKDPGKTLTNEELPITQKPGLVKKIQSLPEVNTIHPFATRYAILKAKGNLEGVLFKGIDSSYNFNTLQPFLKAGSYIEFNDSSYSRQILLSQYIAQQLGVNVNDRILIYFVRPDGSFRPDRLTIKGIFKTGIEEYDKTFMIGDLRLIQRLNGWLPDEIGGYEVFINNYAQTDKIAQNIYELDNFPAIWDAVNIKNISPNIFDWLNMQNITRNLLIGFMVVVAIINLITCLIILVLERFKMIGVLKALGCSNWSIQQIFIYHTLYIAISGIIGGVLFGGGIILLQLKTGFIKLKEETYYLSEAAVAITANEILIICAATFIISFVVLLLPSLLVRRISPIKAIRFS